MPIRAQYWNFSEGSPTACRLSPFVPEVPGRLDSYLHSRMPGAGVSGAMVLVYVACKKLELSLEPTDRILKEDLYPKSAL